MLHGFHKTKRQIKSNHVNGYPIPDSFMSYVHKTSVLQISFLHGPYGIQMSFSFFQFIDIPFPALLIIILSKTSYLKILSKTVFLRARYKKAISLTLEKLPTTIS